MSLGLESPVEQARIAWRSVGVALTLALGTAAAQTESTLQLTYLANMGVALEVGEQRVVIDGFHHGETIGLPAVPRGLLASLEAATGQFHRVDLALSTHRHIDHFSATSVAARLRADTAIHFVAPRQVVDSLRRVETVALGNRVHPVVPPERGRVELDVAGIRIAVLDLPHVQPTRARPHNVGYLIRLGDKTILHVGDAGAVAANFSGHRLSAERIDVVIIPSWFLPRGSGMVRRDIAPRTVVVSHVSLGDTARTRREVERVWPGAIVLARPGQTLRIPR